jgi:hypothetical protein
MLRHSADPTEFDRNCLMSCPAQQIHRKSPRNKMQAKRTEKLITKSKRGQDQVHFQFSTNKIIATFLLKIEKIMKFAGFLNSDFHEANSLSRKSLT